MFDIFLSYAKEDTARVTALVRSLEAQGWSVFWDRNIPPGESFARFIQHKIDSSTCTVVLWTRDSVRSNWVEAEASRANRNNKLVPVLLDAVADDIPLEFSLLQAADLSAWNGDTPSGQFELLTNAIRAKLAPGAVEAEAPRPITSAKVGAAQLPRTLYPVAGIAVAIIAAYSIWYFTAPAGDPEGGPSGNQMSTAAPSVAPPEPVLPDLDRFQPPISQYLYQRARAGNVENGKKEHETVCVACHGTDGNSFIDNWPSLAEQNAEYVIRQMIAFSTGSRSAAIMSAFTNLDEVVVDDLAAYYAVQKRVPREQDMFWSEEGRTLYNEGFPVPDDAPACVTCHRDDTRGLPSRAVPNLRSQLATYLITQMEGFRSGQRTHPVDLVQESFQRATSDEIRNVALFLEFPNDGDHSYGKMIYEEACISCHGGGIDGAPRLDEVAAWQPRLRRGTRQLIRNSVDGMTGNTGVMPPKGGHEGLMESEVAAAVRYMLANIESQ